MITIGIDNGLKGAIVAINDDYKLLAWYDTPTIQLKKGKKIKNQYAPATMVSIIESILLEHAPSKEKVIVWLEMAQAMPKQGLSSTFTTGRGFGLWEGIVAGLGLRYDIVSPRTWTKAVLKDLPPGDPKDRSMMKCQRLFPELPLVKPRGTVLSMDGRSDAALIAFYGLMQLKQGLG